jgi:type VI secretion system protein ImpH
LPDKSVEQDLFDEPYKYQFFQAVRLLETVNSNRQTVGKTALPHEEIVRFRSRITLDFPSSEIHQLEERVDEDGPATLEMMINFMGMVGASGVLPTHYTELIMDRVRHRDTAMWNFLDIFTHRSVSMFYRSWAKYRFPIDYERGSDNLTSFLFDFAGLGTIGIRGRMDVRDESLLPYAGLISQRPHSVNAVENVVEDYFDIRANVEVFHGQWLQLNRQDVTRIGKQKNALGLNTIVGERVWDQQSKFRLRLGPLNVEKFQAFLPINSGHKALKSILDLLIGFELDYDVQLCLDKKQVPKTILTTRAKRRPMLGWTSFLKTLPSEQDDDQLVLELN